MSSPETMWVKQVKIYRTGQVNFEKKILIPNILAEMMSRISIASQCVSEDESPKNLMKDDLK